MKVQHHGSDPNMNTCPQTQAGWHMQIIRKGNLTPFFKWPCRKQSLLVSGFRSWGKCKEGRTNEFNSKEYEIYLLLWLIVLHYLLYSKFHRGVCQKESWRGSSVLLYLHIFSVPLKRQSSCFILQSHLQMIRPCLHKDSVLLHWPDLIKLHWLAKGSFSMVLWQYGTRQTFHLSRSKKLQLDISVRFCLDDISPSHNSKLLTPQNSTLLGSKAQVGNTIPGKGVI